MKRFSPYNIQLSPTALNERGYALAIDEDGKKYQILNALPGETVIAEIFKRKHGTRYGKAITIVQASPNRVVPISSCYLETSPWEIMKFDYENQVKSANLLTGIKMLYPEVQDVPIDFNNQEYGYRNKMEFSFYFADDNSVSFGFHKRDSKRGKVQTNSSALLPESVNSLLDKLLIFLNQSVLDRKSLKGLTVRYSFTTHKVFLQLHVKSKDFPSTGFKDFIASNQEIIQAFIISYSDPKSPAFVETEIIFNYGEATLSEHLNNLNFSYPYNSFFQVNTDIFCHVLNDIRSFLSQIPAHSKLNVGEYYAGIGTIGMSIADLVSSISAVEIANGSAVAALTNASNNAIQNFNLIEEKAENVAETVQKFDLIILDPPRIGIHFKLIMAIKEFKPKYIIYLSCNPKTQVENLTTLAEDYNLKSYTGYNFYPKTPHVEALAILELK